jgi:hypothetical protein
MMNEETKKELDSLLKDIIDGDSSSRGHLKETVMTHNRLWWGREKNDKKYIYDFLDKHDTNARALGVKGAYQYHSGDRDLGMKCYEESLKLDPKDIYMMASVARIYSDNEKYKNIEKAVKYYETIATHDATLWSMSMKIDALKWLEKHYEISDKDTSQEYTKKLLHEEKIRKEMDELLKDAKEGKEDIRKLCSELYYEKYICDFLEGNELTRLFVKMGEEYYNKKNIEKAVEWYVKASKLNDNEARLRLGAICSEKKDYKNAIIYYEIVAKSMKINNEKLLAIHQTLADLYFKDGNINYCIKYYVECYVLREKYEIKNNKEINDTFERQQIMIEKYVTDMKNKNKKLEEENKDLKKYHADLFKEIAKEKNNLLLENEKLNEHNKNLQHDVDETCKKLSNALSREENLKKDLEDTDEQVKSLQENIKNLEIMLEIEVKEGEKKEEELKKEKQYHADTTRSYDNFARQHNYMSSENTSTKINLEETIKKKEKQIADLELAVGKLAVTCDSLIKKSDTLEIEKKEIIDITNEDRKGLEVKIATLETEIDKNNMRENNARQYELRIAELERRLQDSQQQNKQLTLRMEELENENIVHITNS